MILVMMMVTDMEYFLPNLRKNIDLNGFLPKRSLCWLGGLIQKNLMKSYTQFELIYTEIK